MKPFSPTSKCPKCGTDDVRARHEPDIEHDPCWYDRTYKPAGKWPKHEFIRRTCNRCKYEWLEACLSLEDARHD